MARPPKPKKDSLKDAAFDAVNNLLEEDKKPYIIREAALKDDFCNYVFEITKGIGLGDTHKVAGSGIIEDTMRHAFGKFNVHLAVIDDVFKHSGIEIEDVDEYHTDDLASCYHVKGFKITGETDNESIILLGSKYVSSAGGRIDLVSPKIPLDNLSSYKWYNELKAAADEARRQVELYKEGNYTMPEKEEVDKPNVKQLKIGEGDITSLHNAVNGRPDETSDEESDQDFENAKV